MAATLTDTLESVELADGVQIHLRVAGPAVRSVAWLLDLLLFFGILMIVQIAVGAGVLPPFDEDLGRPPAPLFHVAIHEGEGFDAGQGVGAVIQATGDGR